MLLDQSSELSLLLLSLVHQDAQKLGPQTHRIFSDIINLIFVSINENCKARVPVEPFGEKVTEIVAVDNLLTVLSS